MGKTKMIEFNVDYGLNFNSKNIKKDIEKQFKGQEDLIRDYFDKNGKIALKINVDNAVDLDGNPIDKKSLDAFTKKYEKAMNATLKTMIDSFKNNMSSEISDAVSSTLSNDINKLFSEMTDIIVDGIQKMQSNIVSSLSGVKPISISQEDIIDIKPSKDKSEKVFGNITDTIVDNAKTELKSAEENLEKEALKFRLGLKKIQEQLDAEKSIKESLENEKKDRKSSINLNDDYKIKIGNKNYTKEIVTQIKNDEKELEKVLSSFYEKYNKQLEKTDELDDKIWNAKDKGLDTSKLESTYNIEKKKLDNISFIMQKLVSERNKMAKILSVDPLDIEEIFSSSNSAINEYADISDEKLDELIKNSDSRIKEFNKLLENAQKRVDEFSKKTSKTVNESFETENNSVDNENNKISVGKNGKVSSNVQIYPTLNTNSFLKQVSKAVEACEAALKEEPVEVPIKVNPESAGGFIVDIQDIVSEHPIQLTLDSEHFVDQIANSVKGVNIDISGNLTNINSVPMQSVNVPEFYDDNDDEEWEQFLSQVQNKSFIDEFVSNVQAGMSSAVEETEELNSESEKLAINFDKSVDSINETAEVVKRIKETISETANVLVGQVDVFDDPEIKILEEKIKAYEFLDDLRKKRIGTTKKENRTDKENERLKQRILIKKEWNSLSPILENINSTENLILNNENKLQELSTLESKKKLSKVEQNRLIELQNQKKEIEQALGLERKSLEQNKQKLEIAKQQSSFFGKMNNKSLLQFQKDVAGNFKKKTLVTKASENIERIKNSSIGSLDYQNRYKSSHDEIKKNKKQKNSLLDDEHKKLVEIDKLWSGINKSIEDGGKEQALIDTNNQIDILDKKLKEVIKLKIAEESKYKKGQYTSKQYDSIKNSLLTEESDIKSQLKNERHKINVLKKYSEEEIKRITEEKHQKLMSYKEDMKTEQGRVKILDGLRHKDLKSFAQYQYQKSEQQKRIEKQNSYDRQLKEHEQEFIDSGMSKKDAAAKKYEVLKGTDYKANKNAINEYHRQFENIELDLNEILSLMEQIDDLQEKLSFGDVSVEQSAHIKNELSKKRKDLETIINRTGWQSGDILAYKEYHNKLNSQNKENSIVKHSFNVDKFKKDTNSIQDVVNNIQNELDLAEKQNEELIHSVSETEKRLEDSKNKIAINYQNTASVVRETLENLRKEEEKLKEEIEKSNNQDDIQTKKVRLGKVQSQIKNIEYKNKDFLNDSKLQARLDRDFNLLNKETLDDIKIKQSQIIYNKEYIESLKEELAIQKQLREENEPTSDELNARKKELTAQKSKNTRSYNKKINETKTEINNIETAIKEAEKTAAKSIREIDTDISELEKKIDKVKNVLTDIESRKVNSDVKNQTNTNSELYDEYTKKQGVFTKQQYEQKNIIDNAKSELSIVNRELDQMSDRHKDAINRQSFIVQKTKEQIEAEQKKIQEQINSGVEKDKIDQSNLNTLKNQLKIEEKKKKELESQYNLVSELGKRQQIINAVDRVQKAEFSAKQGKVNAQKDLVEDIKIIQSLSQETGVYVGEVKTLVDKAGKEFKTMSFSINNMNKLSDISNDIEKHLQLQDKKSKNEQIIQKTKLPDENIYKNTKKEYAEKIYASFVEEQRLYNEELIKSKDYIRETGVLTEEAEEHILNMYRYMQEYSKISDIKRDELFNIFGIDKDTERNMKFAWKDAQDYILNVSDSSINIEQEKRNQQAIIEYLENQKQLKIKSKDVATKEVDELKKQLAYRQKELKTLEEKKKKETERISLLQKENKQRIDGISNDKEEDNPVKNVDNSIEDSKEQLKELENVDEQVAKSQISNQNEVQNEVQQTTEEIKETNNTLQEQKIEISNASSSTSVPSVIENQQQEAQEEIKETNELLQQQISKAIQAAQISIAEGSYVNIAGSVKIDEGQFGSLSEGLVSVQSVGESLLSVVKNIYTTISNGTPDIIKDIKSVQSPISNITEEAKEAGEAIEEVQVQLSKTSKKLEVVSGGDIDLKDDQFSAVKRAVDAMNKAASSNITIQKIRDAGDITAKYFTRKEEIEDKDGNLIEVIKEYVALNSIFKDTEGQIIKMQHVYDVAENQITQFGNASAKISENFTRQNKAVKAADVQLHSHLNKLDKLKIKYESFDINNFGIDNDGNLFAKIGTDAEKTFDIITGRTKELIKDVILQMSNVETKFKEFQTKASNGALSQTEFENLSKGFSISIEKLENSMNAVNRRINTQLEHTSRSWLNTWQKELSTAEAFVFNIDGSERLNSSGYNAQGLKYIEQYKDALLDLKEMYHTLHEQGEYFSQEQVNNWKRQIQTISDLKKKINSNSSKPYVNGLGTSIDGLSLDEIQYKTLINDSSYARNILSSLAKELAGTDIEVVKLSKDNKVLTYSYKDQNKNIQTCKLSVEDYGKTIRHTSVDSKKHVGFLHKAFDNLKDKLLQIMKYVSAYEIFYKVVNSIRSGVEIVRELDVALTEMRKVSDESIESLKSFQDVSFDIAKSVGTTAKQIQESTADWMRLGESIEEAAKSAEVANILLNVSEFESIDEATESLVSMSAAFDELEKIDIVDKLNLIGNTFAISTDGLATALQNSASALKTAQNDIDESIALATAANAVVQDPDKVGAGLRTIALRITGTEAAKEELQELGEDVDDFVVTTTSKLNEQVKNLTKTVGKDGISLLDDNGNYRSTYEILQDIADVWEQIAEEDLKTGQNRQNALLEMLAGKNRSNILASILQSPDTLRDAYNASINDSEGSAQKELEKYLDSIEGKIAQFQNEVQEFWHNLISSETIKLIVDTGTKLVHIFGDIVDYLGEIGTLATVVGAAFGIGAIKKNSGGRAKQFALKSNQICHRIV